MENTSNPPIRFTAEELSAGWDNRGELPPGPAAGPPRIVRWSYGPPPLSSLIVETPAAYVQEARYQSTLAVRFSVFWKRVMMGASWIEVLDANRKVIDRYVRPAG